MCVTCGCGETAIGDGSATEAAGRAGPHRHHAADHAADHADDGGARTIRLEQDLLARNDAIAAANRGVFRDHQSFVINLVSSPGSGKTTLLARTAAELKARFPVAVIEGDQQTSLDAQRIRDAGVPAVQINTGRGCHLDAHMIGHAFETLDLPRRGALFIENVGNLVCPSEFDLGEHHKVVVVSVTEGEDKPLKYPHMFAAADLMLLNKTDLLPYLDFDTERCRAYALRANPEIDMLEISATTGAGLPRWYDWVERGVARASAAPGRARPEPFGVP